jgi:tRNA(Ile2) C34 agmatinyltransferase TiaS
MMFVGIKNIYYVTIFAAMPKCPICNAELIEHNESHLRCEECQELIPRVYAKDSKIPCCDPLNKCG